MNLAHSASLHSRDNIAPSNPGIKQLERLEGDVGLHRVRIISKRLLMPPQGNDVPRAEHV